MGDRPDFDAPIDENEPDDDRRRRFEYEQYAYDMHHFERNKEDENV